MSQHMKKLSNAQLEFLSVLDAFGCPVPIDVAGQLAPLLPGPLFDLINTKGGAGWVETIGVSRVAITKELPSAVRTQIESINSQEHLSALAGRLYSEDLISKLDPQEKLPLMEKAGKVMETSECEIALARIAFAEKRPLEGRKYIEQAVHRLSRSYEGRDISALFISTTLEFSNLCFSEGRGFAKIDEFLMKAMEAAGRLGDRRSQALINLHLGAHHHFSDRRKEALKEFSAGFEGIKELGDEDILARAATFIGMFYYIQGLFKEALAYLEKAELGNGLYIDRTEIQPLTPVFLGLCTIHLGQFHRAIGYLDFQWRQTLLRADSAIAYTIQALLGTVLVLMRKHREATTHLQQAKKKAEQSGNTFATYLAKGGIALQHFIQGRVEESYDCFKENALGMIEAGITGNYAAPWFLEMAYEFHRLGFEPVPEFEFNSMTNSIREGFNIHMRGVAFRLMAREKMLQGIDRTSIEKDLEESEMCLRKSGNPVQLSKTLQEQAKLELTFGNCEKARKLICVARQMLGGYVDEFFPNECRNLLESQEQFSESQGHKEEFLGRFLEMIESLYPSESQNEIMTKVLTATSRMFGAERSGLFWFPSCKFTSDPKLIAAYNLTLKEVGLDSFRNNMALVLKTFSSNRPRTERTKDHEAGSAVRSVRATLCIPINVHGGVHGVFYYDNSYLDGAFDFLDTATIKQMVHHTNIVIERRFNHLKLQEEKNLLDSKIALYVKLEKNQIIAQSETMKKVLEQTDQIARAECTILILGETGTGKELLARRIHTKSQRSKGPFIIVDSTTIPENLLESELFGHERGAFTGADRQKIGRIELSHQGTLFLDEMGELPLSAQFKLLRVLQDGTFNRIGGNRTINSDFRLIVATNRDLAAEVVAGRFREDLYYRLNVVPIHLPPLRARTEDIPLIANYYLKHYAAKYRRAPIGLTTDQNIALGRYRWPGNIRELKNILERAVLLSGDNQLEINLPAEVRGEEYHPFADSPSLEEVQRRYIRDVLRRTAGKIAGPGGAAEILGMKRTSLYARMRTLGMSR